MNTYKQTTFPEFTLNELLLLTPDTSQNNLPTQKQLEASRTKKIAEKYTGNCRISVYANGFFVYSDGVRSTVQRIHRCKESICYKFLDDTTQIYASDFFLDLPYYIRLTLEGEERLARNQLARDSAKTFSYENTEMESANLAIAPDYLSEIIKQNDSDILRSLLQKLTTCQAEVVQLYYTEGLSQQEIGERLGISRCSVQDRLDGAIKKLRKLYKQVSSDL